MSRFSANPIALPEGVKCAVTPEFITVTGALGELKLAQNAKVSVSLDSDGLHVKQPSGEKSNPLVGTYCRLLLNHVRGVSQGFSRRLELVGVGYRAALDKKKIVLQLGYSHPVEITPPEGVSIELPSQTEIVIKGIDKQKVNQHAAEIRAWRKPEPYKGKGIKYSDEVIVRKEVNKK